MNQLESSRQALTRLMKFCQYKNLTQELAEQLKLTRQTMYLWGTDHKLSERGAKMRIFEISQIQAVTTSPLAPIATFAKKLLEVIQNEAEV